jgi:hypothetical protein
MKTKIIQNIILLILLSVSIAYSKGDIRETSFDTKELVNSFESRDDVERRIETNLRREANSYFGIMVYDELVLENGKLTKSISKQIAANIISSKKVYSYYVLDKNSDRLYLKAEFRFSVDYNEFQKRVIRLMEGKSYIKIDNSFVRFNDKCSLSKFLISNKYFELFYMAKYGKEHERSKYSEHDDTPVINVTWEEANEFCKWWGELIGEDCKLPSFNTCKNINPEILTGNFKDGDIYEYTSKVNSFPPINGIYDLVGNVWQWIDQANAIGHKKIVGGSWDTDMNNLIEAWNNPWKGYKDVGFRCAVEMYDK